MLYYYRGDYMKKYVKDTTYNLRTNKELKEKFQDYCKIMNISPSDVLLNVMIEFNDNAEKIIAMRDIKELRSLFNEKMNIADKEMQCLEEHPAFKE